VNFDQIQTFQQPEQIIENYINNFPNSVRFDLGNDAVYLVAAIPVAASRQSEGLRGTNDLRSARTIGGYVCHGHFRT
jgi:hypothetical protein